MQRRNIITVLFFAAVILFGWSTLLQKRALPAQVTYEDQQQQALDRLRMMGMDLLQGGRDPDEVITRGELAELLDRGDFAQRMGHPEQERERQEEDRDQERNEDHGSDEHSEDWQWNEGSEDLPNHQAPPVVLDTPGMPAPHTSNGSCQGATAWDGSISADGRFVSFFSFGTTDDGGYHGAAYVYDRDERTHTLLDTEPLVGRSTVVSDDGSIVAYPYYRDVLGFRFIKVYHVQTGEWDTISLDTVRTPEFAELIRANRLNTVPHDFDMTRDGRYILMRIELPGAGGRVAGMVVYDRDTQQFTVAPIHSGWDWGEVFGPNAYAIFTVRGQELYPAPNGGFTFSGGQNSVPLPVNGLVYAYRTENDTTTFMTYSPGEAVYSGQFDLQGKVTSMSDDGKVITMDLTYSSGQDLFNSGYVYLYNEDRRIDMPSCRPLELSRDGRFVFCTSSEALDPDDPNGGGGAYVYDIGADRYEAVAVTADGGVAGCE